MEIGFIGTGLMGLPMAQRVLEAGFSLNAYNRTSAKLDALKSSGATIAPAPATVLENSACTVLMLTNGAAVQEVLFSQAARSQLKGKTIIQMGTIAPAESRAIRDQVVAARGDYLEAPVLGSIPEAKAGQLIVMVGGTATQLQTWEPVLRCFGPDPLLVGEVGAAAALKLALNQLIGSLTAAFSTSLEFVSRQGVPPELFMQILRNSALYAPTFDKKLKRMVEGNYADPNFPTKHLAKDINLFLTAAQAIDLNTAAIQGVSQILTQALEMGLADADYSALHAAVSSQKAG